MEPELIKMLKSKKKPKVAIIAIQGVAGSNHHKVVMDNFEMPLEILECSTFDEIVETLLKDESTTAIMAIENSIAGSIIPNYALIDNNNLFITDEFYLNVSHNLMALPNQTLGEITEVHSHYMALLQCKDFFRNYPHIKLVEDIDTALTAKRIQAENLKGIGALATANAAELYGLQIYAKDVQTIKSNATRFVSISVKNENENKSEINKASLKFELSSKRGSLASVLNIVSDCGLSLTKIQSLPIIDNPWKYAFFVDVIFENIEDYNKTKSIVSLMAENFKILGEYKNRNL